MSGPSRIGRLLVVAATVSLVGGPAAAQTVRAPAIAPDELKKLAALPDREQLLPQNQARLQRWYLGQIAIYEDMIRATYVGRSRLVSPGPAADPAGRLYTQTFTAPTGRGRSTVVWTNVSTASTAPDGTIRLPRGNVTITGGEDSTCWHESLHAIFLSTPATVRVEPYEKYLMLYTPGQSDYAEAQDHVYIEALAQKTFEWLFVLGAFEREILAAADNQEELRARSVVINYEVENGVWAKAHAAWLMAWTRVVKIAPVAKG